MPVFSYKAKSLKGETKEGSLEAEHQSHLAKLLHEQGFILIDATAENEKKGTEAFMDSLQGMFGVTLKDKLMFTRNLQVMAAAGISLPRALTTLSEQAKSKAFKDALVQMADHITKGESLSQAAKLHPKIFSEFFYYMVKVGEESGTLDTSLKNLATQMEREHELKSQIIGALIYPAVIIGVMILIGIAMLVVVVPSLAEVFIELEVELPATTQLVIGAGQFFSQHFLIAAAIPVALFFALKFAFKTEGGAKAKDAVMLRLPILGPLVKKLNASYMIRTLSVLIESGVPFLKSLEILVGVLPNVYFKAALIEAQEHVQRGEKLSAVLKEYTHLFPQTVVQMLEVGEETGETAKILKELAEFFEGEVTAATKNLAAVIEPMLMVLIGAVVGFFAISMVQPIYSLISTF